jgi:hypothetical protein
MHQFRYRLLHLFLLLLSAAFYFKVRRVANIQTFLAEQNAAMSSDGEVELLAQYGQQFREARAFTKIVYTPPISFSVTLKISSHLHFS